ncbi:hypothetical protein ACFL6H_04920 [Candidatus Latescibacterota bacterium]
MKEKNLRQAHRSIGIPLAIFVILQSATGIVLSVEDLFGTYYDTIIRDIHYRFGLAGNVYRIGLGVCILWMAISGLLIFQKIRARQKAANS